MNQRLERLVTLAPFLQDPAKDFLAQARVDLHMTLLVVFVWRSGLEQLRLYAQGRELRRDDGVWDEVDTTKIVTNALPGHSAHNVVTTTGLPASMAMDLIPLLQDGAAAWMTPMSEWSKLWALAWKHGFDPMGDVTGAYLKWDLGHFEEPGWKQKLTGLGLVQPASIVSTLT